MLPNYLIIGAARCGTSWLAKNLMLHPEIFMHDKKELHFFDRHYEKGVLWYERQFDSASGKAIGEGTPAYMYHEDTAQLIKKHIPHVKLIATLRDPVERAYSHYYYRERERQAEKQSMTFESKIAATPRLIEEGLYARKLEKYFELFPRENILVLLYDELKSDPELYLRRVFDFLGVDREFRSPLIGKEINAAASKLGRSYSLYLLYRGLVKMRLFELAERVNNINRKQEFPAVKRATRERLLKEYYLADIHRLEQLLEQDLSEWKRV